MILRSDNGDIRVQGVRAALDVRTDNGNIQLMLPADGRLLVEARTDRGTLRSELVLQGELGTRRWSARLNPPANSKLLLVSDNGDIRLAALEGVLGD